MASEAPALNASLNVTLIGTDSSHRRLHPILTAVSTAAPSRPIPSVAGVKVQVLFQEEYAGQKVFIPPGGGYEDWSVQ